MLSQEGPEAQLLIPYLDVFLHLYKSGTTLLFSMSMKTTYPPNEKILSSYVTFFEVESLSLLSFDLNRADYIFLFVPQTRFLNPLPAPMYSLCDEEAGIA